MEGPSLRKKLKTSKLIPIKTLQRGNFQIGGIKTSGKSTAGRGVIRK